MLSWDSDANGSLDQYRSLSSMRAPAFLRLSREGNVVIAACSSDGTAWTDVGSVTVPAGTALDAGLFMTATNGGSGNRGRAEFAGFTLGTVGSGAPGPGSTISVICSHGPCPPVELTQGSLLASEVLRGDGTPLAVDLDVAGVERLVLDVTDHDGDNWWDRTSWGAARATCG